MDLGFTTHFNKHLHRLAISDEPKVIVRGNEGEKLSAMAMDKDAYHVAIGTIEGSVSLITLTKGHAIETLKHTSVHDSSPAMCLKWQRSKKEGNYSNHLLIARADGAI